MRFCPVLLRPPARLGKEIQLPVYAVYADEVDCSEGEEPVAWMLLTSEPVTTIEQAKTMLRWYSYRWRIEMRQPQYPHSRLLLSAEAD